MPVILLLFAFFAAGQGPPTSELEQKLLEGQRLLKQNRLDEALKKFQLASRLGDPSGRAQFGQGLVYLAKAQYSEALNHLRTAAVASPKEPDRLFTLAATEFKLGHRSEARQHLSDLTKWNPGNSWVRFRVATLLRESGLLKESEAEYRAVAALLQSGAPITGVTLPEVLLQLAQLALTRFDYVSAVNYLDQIRGQDLSPEARAAVLGLEGHALLGSGKASDARERLRQAVQFRSASPDHTVRLVWTELLAGNTLAAKALAESLRMNWPDSVDAQQMFALAERESLPERTRVPFSDDWHVKGEGVVCCPCDVPCPCRSNAPPTRGRCENTGVFQIQEGHYGKISLSNLKFAAAGCSMGPQVIPSVLYVDQSASDDQLVAIEKLYQSFMLVRPVLFSVVKRVPILFAAHFPLYELNIADVLRVKIQRRRDSARVSAVDYFSNVLEYAQNLVYQVDDPSAGLRWDYSGRQANFRTFDLDAQDYREGHMLVQFADFSGSFNDRQRALIKSLGLPGTK